MEVAEAYLVEFNQAAAFAEDDLCANGDEVLLGADGDVVVVGADEGLADGEAAGHVVGGFGDAADAVCGAIDEDEAVITDNGKLGGSDAKAEIGVLFGDAVFEDLDGVAAESAGLIPGDFRF